MKQLPFPQSHDSSMGLRSLMKRCLVGVAISASLLASPSYADIWPAASEIEFDVSHHDAPLSGVIWYPTESDTGPTSRVASNAVWQGVEAFEDSDPVKGSYPLVFISHGMGGHPYSLSWLASDLAQRGAIVVGVAHRGSTWRDFDMQRGLNHWTRAADVSTTIDWVLGHDTYGELVDSSRIHVAGFSYGGWTALSVAGLEGNLEWYVDHCAKSDGQSSHCTDIERGGAKWDLVNEVKWNASYKDSRITSVAAIDPGLLFGVSAEDSQQLIDDVLLIGLGEGEDRLYATDFSGNGSGFVDLVPDATVMTMTPANHYSAFLLCNPEGAEILKLEGDDPVCTDPEQSDRGLLHRAMVGAIAGYFGI